MSLRRSSRTSSTEKVQIVNENAEDENDENKERLKRRSNRGSTSSSSTHHQTYTQSTTSTSRTTNEIFERAPIDKQIRPRKFEDIVAVPGKKADQWLALPAEARQQCVSAVTRLFLLRGSRHETLNGEKIKVVCEKVNKVPFIFENKY